jgi:hypothetical protein
MLALWWRTYVTCQRLHEVYSQAKSDPSFARSPLDTALRNAAAVTEGSVLFVLHRCVASPRSGLNIAWSLNAQDHLVHRLFSVLARSLRCFPAGFGGIYLAATVCDITNLNRRARHASRFNSFSFQGGTCQLNVIFGPHATC